MMKRRKKNDRKKNNGKKKEEKRDGKRIDRGERIWRKKDKRKIHPVLLICYN